MIRGFAQRWNFRKEVLSLEAVRAADRFLAAGAALTAVLFLWVFFSSSPDSQSRKMFPQRGQASLDEAKYMLPARSEWSSYKDVGTARALFKAPVKNPPLTASTPLLTGSPLAASNLSSVVVLRGVLPGDPAQAILEDTGRQKTYYLSVGQEADGIVVDEISKDSVIVRIGDEQRKLPL